MKFIALTMLSFTQYSAPNTIKKSCYIDKNQNQTFFPNVIFNITSNDIVEKNKKNTEVARREPSLIMTRNEIFLLTYLTRYKNRVL